MSLAGRLKPSLIDFALSPRFRHYLSAAIERDYPGGLVMDEMEIAMAVDHFVLQEQLPSGQTVVDVFVAEHPELTGAERDLLLGWHDVVEGIFEVRGKDRDAVLLFNLLDELTYRARSNLGHGAFRPLKKGMFVVVRLVPLGADWMVSGHVTTYPATSRDEVLALAAREAMQHPATVFRNPAKLASARQSLVTQYEAFTEVFGTDLIVVPAAELPATVESFYKELARRTGGSGQAPPPMQFPDEIFDADGIAIHFVPDEGLSIYPDYHLLERLFTDPSLIARRRYRDCLSGFLGDPDLSPEPLRRLAESDPAKASKVFTRLLKRKRGFSWAADGEALLRTYKPGYFDGDRIPRTVMLSDELARAR